MFRLNKLDCSSRSAKFLFFCLAWLIEFVCWLLLMCGFMVEPFITRYTLSLISQDCTLDITRAKNELKYSPIKTNGIKEILSTFDQSNSPNRRVRIQLKN